jgi:hypothetical protein
LLHDIYCPEHKKHVLHLTSMYHDQHKIQLTI